MFKGRNAQPVPTSLICSIVIVILLRVAREVFKLGQVDRLQLRAGQLVCKLAEIGTQAVEETSKVGNETVEEIGERGKGQLQGEAEEVVSFQKRVGIEDALGQVGEGDAGKGVDLSRIAANALEFWVMDIGIVRVEEEWD